jgi:signal transduction histidine kinase
MARLGAMALALERAEAKARHQAALEENLQLALWRMDSILAPLIAEESARPYFAYSPLYPAERAFTCMFAEIQRGDVLMPSPLLNFSSPQIRLHFQYGPDGKVNSPQVPSGNMRDLAEARYLAPDSIERAELRLRELKKLVNRHELARALTVEETTQTASANRTLAYGPALKANPVNEYTMRSRSAKLAQSANQIIEAVPLAATSTVTQGPLLAVWFGPTLILARQVRVEEGVFLQGCWLDWDVIRAELLRSVDDLTPDARLEPVHAGASSPRTRMLAALPVQLVPAAAAVEPERWWSSVRVALVIAWSCLLLAAAAVALVLRSALSLSDRRGTFVSAVTHELRTPLTTFRLYTEMLDEGMVRDSESQRTYLKTLRAEADRLGHLVENVLSFARLERGRAADNTEIVSPADLLDRLVPRLTFRARQAGMELVAGATDVDSPVRADVSVVDQILSNLVDNAVKYAATASDRRIHIDLAPSGSWLALSVRDHGPGLDRSVLRRLFRPFSKSAHEAAQSAPGVGLGLALSRRLARTLGGDLRLTENGPHGARFTLTIPFV